MEQTARLAIGIDLGTTFSVVACLDSDGKPQTIPNAEGDLSTPSVVLFEESSITVGKEAQKAAPLEPNGVAEAAKRDMGHSRYHRPIHGKSVPPEVIQSLVLKKLKRDAEEKLGPFEKVVITVPAYFNEPRRKATQDAGRLAGLDVLDIINEPTAAAIAYGCGRGPLTKGGEARESERVLVYDLGGGTFDVTVMEIQNDNYNTIATAGDVHLGGMDWDRRLADKMAEEFLAQHHAIDPRDDPAGLQRLMREAEDAKRTLSARQKTTIVFEHAGDAIRFPITRDEFESLTADLLDRTLFTTRSVLKMAKLEWKDISRVLLVGGSTRMPAVWQKLEALSGQKLDRTLPADEAVAHGAAIYASLLLPTATDEEPAVRVRNVNSHSLGVLAKDPETGRPKNSVVIPTNTPLPVTKGKRFRTVKTNQSSVTIRIIEGGDASGKNSTPIGNCIIHDLPEGLPAGTPVEVFFTYAENGRLKVRARLSGVKRETVLMIERESGLSEEKLKSWKEKLLGLLAKRILE